MRSRRKSIPEREVHVRLWEIFKNVIYREKFEFEGTQFVDIKVEPTINGRPDLVIEAVERGKAKKIPLMVIETKRKVPYRDPRFDPYSIQVIKQAVGYANLLGADYFATCNGEIMVVFQTFTPGVPLIQRRLKQYKVFWGEEFARIVLKELVRFKLGIGRWLPLDDIFVERLRSFHRFITPFMYEALAKKLKEDKKLEKEYVNWLKSQMFEYSDKVNETIAEQMSYLLMNKIAFYKTLESQIVDVDIDKLDKIETKSGVEFSKRFQEKLRHFVDKADYEGIFKPTILDSVPIPDKLVYHLNEFIEELNAYNLGKIKADVIGRVYEDLISPGERHRLGQYYTPPPIVDLIVELCIKSPSDKVLDPGCGSGSFLVKAYHKLRDLKKKENPFRKDEDLHQELLEQVYGIDINPFPTQLSSMNLAVRNLKVRSRHINLFPMDFFKAKLGMALLPKELDAIITNPPYTRQEEMEYKDRIRETALAYSDGSRIEMSGQAGIYAYFFTHSTKFLKQNGMMGQITSDTWLDVGFGEDLKQFFLDHFKIHSIIWYDVRAFERPLVGTCIAILEKEDISKKDRDSNLVKFVRIKTALPIEEIVKTIEKARKEFDDERIGVTLKLQKELDPKEKWGLFLRAPVIYFKLRSNPKMVRLGDPEIAKIKRGYTTGANKFFYLNKKKIKAWGIEKQFLEPVVTSPKDVELELREKDINKWVLMVHGRPKEELSDFNVLEYIEDGENVETKIRGGKDKGKIIKGYQNLSTLRSRRIWYSLSERKPSPLLLSCKIWERFITVQNKIGAQSNKAFYEIRPVKDEHTIVLAGILNSSLTAFMAELQGRFYGGGVLELEVYECKDLPILNPEKLSKAQIKRIEDVFTKLCDAQHKGDAELEQKTRNELDNAIFDMLKLKEVERKQVLGGLESLRRMRLQRKEVDVLVETAEKWKPRKKAKRRKIVEEVPSKRLDTWLKDSSEGSV